MTTDTTAVARFYWSEDEMQDDRGGDYVLFTDYERVVRELENYQRLTDEVLADRHALIASLRDELETLNEAQAVCDGTIPIALLHWHQRALAAESALAASRAEVEGLRDAMFAVYSVAANGGNLSRLHTEIERMRDAMEKGNV